MAERLVDFPQQELLRHLHLSVWYNGITSASQADDTGSTPVTDLSPGGVVVNSSAFQAEERRFESGPGYCGQIGGVSVSLLTFAKSPVH